MTQTIVYNALLKRRSKRNQTGTKNLTLEQQLALGNLALLGGPAFMVGLWGLAAFTSGLISIFSSID